MMGNYNNPFVDLPRIKSSLMKNRMNKTPLKLYQDNSVINNGAFEIKQINSEDEQINKGSRNMAKLC